MRVLPALLLVLTSFPAGGWGQRPDTPTFRLDEAFAVIVPDSISVGSLHVRGRDSMILWTPVQGEVWTGGASGFRRIGSGIVRHPIAASFVEDGGIEVVDGLRRAILRFAPNGDFQEERPVVVRGALHSAVHTRGGWLIGVVVSGESFAVVGVGKEGVEEVGHFPFVDGHLTLDGGAILVTEPRSPFRSVRQVLGSPAGEGRRFGSIALAHDSLRALAAYPMLPLDRGYLQVIADLASDRRHVFVFDSAGNVLRSVRLEMPGAFVQSIPDRQLLIGSRTTDVQEVLGYHWEWERER